MSFPTEHSLNEMIEDLKRFSSQCSIAAVCEVEGKIAARLLGISRDSLKHYMKSLGYFEEE